MWAASTDKQTARSFLGRISDIFLRVSRTHHGGKKGNRPTYSRSHQIMDTKTWELIGLAVGFIASLGAALYVLNAFPRWIIDRQRPVRVRRLATHH